MYDKQEHRADKELPCGESDICSQLSQVDHIATERNRKFSFKIIQTTLAPGWCRPPFHGSREDSPILENDSTQNDGMLRKNVHTFVDVDEKEL